MAATKPPPSTNNAYRVTQDAPASLSIEQKVASVEQAQSGAPHVKAEVERATSDGRITHQALDQIEAAALVTTKSDHAVNPWGMAVLSRAFPSGPNDWLTTHATEGVGQYFIDTINGIRDIAEGRGDPVTRESAIARGLLVVE